MKLPDTSQLASSLCLYMSILYMCLFIHHCGTLSIVEGSTLTISVDHSITKLILVLSNSIFSSKQKSYISEFSQTVVTICIWLINTWNVTGMTKEMSFKFYSNLINKCKQWSLKSFLVIENESHKLIWHVIWLSWQITEIELISNLSYHLRCLVASTHWSSDLLDGL